MLQHPSVGKVSTTAQTPLPPKPEADTCRFHTRSGGDSPSRRLPVIVRTPRGPRAERPRGPAANHGAFSHIDPSGFTNCRVAIHSPRWWYVHSRLFVGLTVLGGTIRHSVVPDARVADASAT